MTQGAQAVVDGDALTGVAQSYLWGMGRVIALEHPELHPVRIDLDGRRRGAMQAALLHQELVKAPAQPEDAWEDQVAFRHAFDHEIEVVAQRTDEGSSARTLRGVRFRVRDPASVAARTQRE